MDKKMEIIDRAKYLYYSNACSQDIEQCVNTALAEAGGVSNVVPQDELRGIYCAFDIDEKTYEANFAAQLTRETCKEITYEAMQNERNTEVKDCGIGENELFDFKAEVINETQ